MKQFVSALLLLGFLGCTKDGTPTGPSGPTHTPVDPPPAATWFYVDLTGYREDLGPGYAKVYSDSSWEKYGGIETVKGTAYLAILVSDSARYYYTMTTCQYAGHKLKGEDPIIFDEPNALLPASWRSDTTVTVTTKFAYMNNVVVMKTSYQLVDTVGIATPLGSFSPVLHFYVRVDITTSSGVAPSKYQDIWLARGPAGIKIQLQGRAPVYFDHGYVNGRSWGRPSNLCGTATRAASSAEAFVKGLLP
jgi:hypothetical protein